MVRDDPGMAFVLWPQAFMCLCSPWITELRYLCSASGGGEVSNQVVSLLQHDLWTGLGLAPTGSAAQEGNYGRDEKDQERETGHAGLRNGFGSFILARGLRILDSHFTLDGSILRLQ